MLRKRLGIFNRDYNLWPDFRRAISFWTGRFTVSFIGNTGNNIDKSKENEKADNGLKKSLHGLILDQSKILVKP